MIKQKLVQNLQLRANNLRREILTMIYKASSGHPGGSLSIAELMTVLYFHVLRLDAKNPDWPDRDRFILSKGHACPAWYACLAMKGFFDMRTLNHLREINYPLQGHPDMRKTVGIDMTTGSLGNGLSAGIGMALAAKLDKKSYRVYVLLGDGEIDEGIVWEGAMSANKYKLNNLIAIIDYNKLQLDGHTEEVMPLEPLAQKWKAFGWNVLETDGHNIAQILSAIERAQNSQDKPSVIIAHTIKGKGVSFMENKALWHGKPPNKEEFEQAIREISQEGWA